MSGTTTRPERHYRITRVDEYHAGLYADDEKMDRDRARTAFRGAPQSFNYGSYGEDVRFLAFALLLDALDNFDLANETHAAFAEECLGTATANERELRFTRTWLRDWAKRKAGWENVQ